jgi:hypothetical protein
MRSFTLVLALAGVVLALPVEKRANVVPSTCDPNVVKTVLDTVTALGAPETVILSTFETALVESRFNNLNFGDRDSKGVFQQRPSQGYTDVNDVPHATKAFAVQVIIYPSLGRG